MDLWVDAEYTDEFAVLSAWLGILVPWNITYSALDIGNVLFVRFPLFQVRYTFGIPFAQAVSLSTAPGALAFQAGQTIAVAYRVWVLGAAIFGLALLLSIVMFVADEQLDGVRVDFSRVMGWLLLATAVVLTAATWFLAVRGFPGIPIPLGLLGLYVLGGVLVVAKRQ